MTTVPQVFLADLGKAVGRHVNFTGWGLGGGVLRGSQAAAPSKPTMADAADPLHDNSSATLLATSNGFEAGCSAKEKSHASHVPDFKDGC